MAVPLGVLPFDYRPWRRGRLFWRRHKIDDIANDVQCGETDPIRPSYSGTEMDGTVPATAGVRSETRSLPSEDDRQAYRSEAIGTMAPKPT